MKVFVQMIRLIVKPAQRRDTYFLTKENSVLNVLGKRKVGLKRRQLVKNVKHSVLDRKVIGLC